MVVVFFDFDNTIATCDVFDSMLPRFSKGDLWIKLEEEWKNGKIGSQACLEGQLRGMSITKEIIEHHRGQISIVSAPGAGTQVSLQLPVEQPSQDA